MQQEKSITCLFKIVISILDHILTIFNYLVYQEKSIIVDKMQE